MKEQAPGFPSVTSVLRIQTAWASNPGRLRLLRTLAALHQGLSPLARLFSLFNTMAQTSTEARCITKHICEVFFFLSFFVLLCSIQCTLKEQLWVPMAISLRLLSAQDIFALFECCFFQQVISHEALFSLSTLSGISRAQ